MSRQWVDYGLGLGNGDVHCRGRCWLLTLQSLKTWDSLSSPVFFLIMETDRLFYTELFLNQNDGTEWWGKMQGMAVFKLYLKMEGHTWFYGIYGVYHVAVSTHLPNCDAAYTHSAKELLGSLELIPEVSTNIVYVDIRCNYCSTLIILQTEGYECVV